MAKEKKATVRDIAKKAGVSVATVSYVLNDKEGTKISDATRKKVLQVANILNYQIPEKYKNNDTTKSSYTIGIIYSILTGIEVHPCTSGNSLLHPVTAGTPSRNAQIMQLINLLAERFERMKFNCMLLPLEPDIDRYEPVQGLDGIIAIDLHERDFKIMSGSYFIPIMCLDMMINDFLFYQIHTDFEQIADKAAEMFKEDYYLLTDSCFNEGYSTYISSVFGKDRVLFFDKLTKKELSSLKNKKLLVYGDYLGMIISRFTNDENVVIISGTDGNMPGMEGLRIIHNDLEKKANLAMNIMMNALEKKFDVKHEYKVL